MAGGGRGGDGGGDGQWRGGDGQQGGRVDFAPPSVRAIEANTSARAQADKSTLKVSELYFDDYDKPSTLQVYLPNGGFNVVKFGDATDIKVENRIMTTMTRPPLPPYRHDHLLVTLWQRFRLKINHEPVKTGGLHLSVLGTTRKVEKGGN